MSVHALASVTAPTIRIAESETHSSPSLLPNPPSPTGYERQLVGRASVSQGGSAQGPSAVFNEQVVPSRDLHALRETCRNGRVAREAENVKMPDLVQLRAKRAADLAIINGTCGIKLDESVTHIRGRNAVLPPVTVGDYCDAIDDQRGNPDVPNLMTLLQEEKAPIQLTLREAFEYVMQKIEIAQSEDTILLVKDDEFMIQLTQIEFTDENAAMNFSGLNEPSKYRSWYDVICKMLKSLGRIYVYNHIPESPSIIPM